MIVWFSVGGRHTLPGHARVQEADSESHLKEFVPILSVWFQWVDVHVALCSGAPGQAGGGEGEREEREREREREREVIMGAGEGGHGTGTRHTFIQM